MLTRCHAGKVVQDGQFDDVAVEQKVLAMEVAEVAALSKQVANVTESERTIGSLVVILDQLINSTLFYLEALRGQFGLEQVAELLFGWIEDFHLVWNPS